MVCIQLLRDYCGCSWKNNESFYTLIEAFPTPDAFLVIEYTYPGVMGNGIYLASLAAFYA